MSEKDAIKEATYYVRRVVLSQREKDRGGYGQTIHVERDVRVELRIEDDGETLRVIVEDRYE